jgi:uncharacterized protein (DUF2235 family)
MYGLLPNGNEAFVPYAVRMLTGVNSADPSLRERAFMLAFQFRETFDPNRHCGLHFVGVWDTVSSVGWIEYPLRLPYTASNPTIMHGRHAVAIDERRAFFRANLWWPASTPEATGPRDVKQVWFAGVHCDVGGGYPEEESALSKIALKWMLDEAEALGLLCDPVRKDTVLGLRGGGYVAADAKADAHESLSNWWRLTEVVPKKHYDRISGTSSRRMNLGRPRTFPPAPLIHPSVYERGDEYVKRLPPDAVMSE